MQESIGYALMCTVGGGGTPNIPSLSIVDHAKFPLLEVAASHEPTKSTTSTLGDVSPWLI
ncbi:hypothetical protein N7478_002631 [Penicillium angulare]|uniref:uncharacterized protein n=1 Tax=Penicillium angulare TaxID=116970 RepID=UPI0025414205|nr:uncharacterized protein N7478_002631 [Penicillium angulare]KAJ5286945.1 hypothetical protein N7478_002631 [Penicillium angulare]